MATTEENSSGAVDEAFSAVSSQMEIAAEIKEVKPDDASEIYRAVIANPSTSSEVLRVKEVAISNLGEIYASQHKAEALRSLLGDLRPYFTVIPKAKTAKIVRTIIDLVAKVPNSTQLQIELCREMVGWTRKEKRTFLRQRVEARLAALYMESRDFQAALTLITTLVREVRRLDDKLLLVDIDLLESKLHHQLRNIPKAKASLTAARTAANAIYVPPAQQAVIDMQSGILHAEEKDYKTAFSYFFEAFEGFHSLDDPKAVLCLKYMLLCKVMVNQADDVSSIIASKAGLKYIGPQVDAMRAVAQAHSKRSLKGFEAALKKYREQLAEDPIIDRHLSSLYDSLFEQNLLRLIEPYSRVQIQHVARLIDLSEEKVESKLSQMILDHKFEGTLDQGEGCVIIFEQSEEEALFDCALKSMTHMSKVVDSLYAKSVKILS